MGDAQHAAAGAEQAPAYFAQLKADLRGPDLPPTLNDLALNYRTAVKERETFKAQAASAIKVPAADAKPEEVAAYRKAIGVPDAPAGYGVTPPEGMVKERLDAFLIRAHKAGMRPGDVREALAGFQDEIKFLGDASNTRKSAEIQAAAEDLKKRLAAGDEKKFAELKERGKRAAVLIGGEKLSAKVAADPELAEAFIKLSSVFAEDGSPIGSLTGGKSGEPDLKKVYGKSPQMFGS